MSRLPSTHGLLRSLPRIAAIAAAVVAVTAFAGWAFNYPVLRSVIPGAVEMKANTTIGLLVSALLLLITGARENKNVHRCVLALATFLALIGIATLTEYAFDLRLGIDELLFNDTATAYNAHRGRMSPYTASAFVALAVAFITMGWRRTRRLSFAATLGVLVIGLVSALGYLWNAQEIVTDQLVPPVAINTAIVLMWLSIGMLIEMLGPSYFARGEQGQKSLETIMVTALVIVFAIFATGATYTYRAIAHFDASIAVEGKLEHIRTAVDELQEVLSAVQAAQRSYLITNAREQEARYNELVLSTQAQLATLNTLASDKQVDETVVKTLTEASKGFLATLDREIELRRSRQWPLAQIVAESPADRMREILARLDDPIADQYVKAQTDRHHDAVNMRVYGLALILLLLTLTVISAVFVIRAVRRTARTTQERRHHDELARLVLGLLASTRNRSHALDGTLRFLAELVPGSQAAFYAPASDETFVRETAFDPQAWPAQIHPHDEAAGSALQRGNVIGQPAVEIESSHGTAYRTVYPVTYRQQNLGVVILRTPRAITPDERAFLMRQVAHLAVTLTNLKQLSDLSDLSEQLVRKNDVLQQQAVELERANRLKSEFLATMSHELRTPLNAIIGFAEVLKDNLAGDLTGEQLEYIGDILASGEHLLALINDILDLSKVEAGKMELDPEPVDIQALIGNAISMVRERAVSHNVRLQTLIPGVMPPLQADARKLKQICYNLLSNAVKFSRDGGEVTVSATQRNEPDGPWLDITVADNGIGISATNQARLFQPFMQADASLSKHYEGTGLGLALVKRLVELHGGSVSVESEAGIGSTFTVSFPYCEAKPVLPTPHIHVARAPRLGRLQPLALVIEDQDRDAELLRLQLERSGFNVIREVDAQRGLTAARQHKPDLITVDVLLEGMNGWHVLEQLKSDTELATIPVVIVSIVADKKKGLSLGAVAVLQKPIDRREVESLCAAIALTGRIRQPCNVMVVDDDLMAGQIIGTYFESVGCKVNRVTSGGDAIDRARAEMPDLVVLDLMMPDVSGFDVLAALRSDPATASIRVVVVTAKTLSSGERTSLQQDTLAVLEKGTFRRLDLLKHIPREQQEA